MITELEISGLGVIDRSAVEFGPGFTVFTGETGAGKTMIISGLGLLLGARADPQLIRIGAEQATVTGRFAELSPAVSEAVDSAGGDLDEGELIVSRRLAGKRSRAWLGGAQVPASATASLAEELITIHGQSGQIRLARPDYQRGLLDRAGGAELAATLTRYRAAFAEHKALRNELDSLVQAAAERERERELLVFGLAEIEAQKPQPAEDRELTAESDRLQSVDDLQLSAQQALSALTGDGAQAEDGADAQQLLAVAAKALEGLVATDASAATLLGQLTEAATLVSDVSAEVSAYLSALEADPARLEWLMNRRAELTKLTRKYGADIDAVLAWSEQARERLLGLDGSDERIAELGEEVEAAKRRVMEHGAALTALRAVAAERLGAAVGAELSALAMPKATLKFEVSALDSPSPDGLDAVLLCFSANPGSAPGPLAKVASGGELSRVRLALEVVLADSSSSTSFVFDEIDAGVGGQVAVEIGRRLARLAEGAQVIVVTHLAQVAAFADRHYVVAKSDDGRITTSGVVEVSEAGRRSELARMMAGLTDSDTALAHAEELLALTSAPTATK